MTVSADSTLLSQSLETFQSLRLQSGDQVVISVLDSLPIGSGSDIGDDVSVTRNFALFAEEVLLSSSFRMANGVLAVHALDVTGGDGTLDVSGTPGATVLNLNQDPSKPGTSGGNGDPGGSLSLYVEAAGPALHYGIDARGGDGGPGQRGTAGTPGADGGDGGAGGTIVAVLGVSACGWLTQLRQINLMTGLGAKQAALSALVATIPADDLLAAPARSAITAAAVAETHADMDAALQNAGYALLGAEGQFMSALQSRIDVSGGNYGVHGDGSSNGNNGGPGKPGAASTIAIGTPADLLQQSAPPMLIAHPSQCRRLLERAKLMYFTLDPVKDPAGVGDLMTLLLRLQARTAVFAQATSSSALVKYYAAHEAEVGAVGSVEQLRAIHDEATAYLASLKQGRDFFGLDAQAVPLASFAFYQDLLATLIDDFEKIEKGYQEYFTALQNGTAQMTAIRGARAQQGAVKATASTDLKALRSLAAKTSAVIGGYQTILPPLKQALADEMANMRTTIKHHFDFSFDALLQSLQTLAFAPESQFMMLTQGAGFLYNGTTKVTNDQGVPVKKDYIVKQLKAVGADVASLTEGFSQLDDGTIQPDDPGAAKLVADEKQIMSMLSSFDFTGLDDLQKAFDAYVGKIIERNNQILTYNAIVLLMYRDQQLIAQAQASQADLTDKALATMSPQMPDLVTYVSSLYYAARQQVMETLNLTARAYRFWALSDDDLVADAFGNQPPPQIDSTILKGAQASILGSYRRAVESFGTDSSRFPARDSQTGIIVNVPTSMISTFKLLGQCMVKVPVATRKTTKRDNPFAAMADVRVGIARAWIDGAKTSDGELTVQLTHTGSEAIANQSGDVFNFTHDPVTKDFKYRTANAEVLEDGTFSIQQHSTPYAALGPFTTWHVVVDKNANADLDLSEVTGIRLEFHGTSLALI